MFNNCTALREVVIPDSVTEIASTAFLNCAGLVDKTGMLILQDCLFCCVPQSDTVVIPDGVTEIADCALRDCHDLRRVVIPESVTKIGVRAFAGCSSLETISIPRV